MNFRVTEAWEENSFPLTSMIDIVFLLLFFFLTLSTLYHMERQIDIRVPEVKASTEKSTGEVVINVDREGRILIRDRQFTTQELSDRLTALARHTDNPSVVIRGDEGAFYGVIAEVMGICVEAGITDFGMATLPEEAGGR